MTVHETKNSPESCLLSCAWKDYTVLEQTLYTPFEAQECRC